ncbi:MAG: GNAT family N-acetyltransferase [Dehalococcoidales bacterium]|nr:GNAT family N-acetyltransferase [Dehalococcoidales bacterium]
MSFSVKPASLEQKQIISSLLQPYLTELSRFPDENLDYKDGNGTYFYPYLNAYWLEKERSPYLLYDDRRIAGFALVRQDGEHWEMAKFYVLPEFRRCGLGMTCAMEIFKRHPGEWRIGYNKQNQASRALWQKLAELLSKGDILAGASDASHDFTSFLV